MGKGRARWAQGLAFLGKGSPVRAAGGVPVRRSGSGVPEVLVVHRPRYDDWSFPKGKADSGESDEQCALREVEEETGMQCRLGKPLLTASYADGRGRPKTVKYWAMEPVSGEFTVNDEVDEALWVDLEGANNLLSYDHDMALVEQLIEEEIRSASVLLVRHGTAGHRKRWAGEDRFRPLDGRGRRQAVQLVEMLSPYPIKRVLTSGFLRCAQSVEPLAMRLGLEIEIAKELEEGAEREDMVRLADNVRGELAVMCTHGDVLGRYLGPGAPIKKGSVWVLTRVEGRLEPCRYLPPS